MQHIAIKQHRDQLAQLARSGVAAIRFNRIFNKDRHSAVRRHDGADLLVDRSVALHWLMHEPHGRSLLLGLKNPDPVVVADYLVEAATGRSGKQQGDAETRVASNNKQRVAVSAHLKEFLMNPIQSMLKACGGSVVGLAKVIVAQGNSALGENDFSALIAAEAEQRGTTFAKMFMADTSEGRLLRKARDIVQWNKSIVDYPPKVTGEGFDDADDWRDRSLRSNEFGDGTSRSDGHGEGEAYACPEEKAADLQKRDPTLSHAQAFAKVYQDPANRGLVVAERARYRVR